MDATPKNLLTWAYFRTVISLADWWSEGLLMCAEFTPWDSFSDKPEVIARFFKLGFFCIGGGHAIHWATTTTFALLCTFEQALFLQNHNKKTDLL